MCDRSHGYKLPVWHRRDRGLFLVSTIFLGSALILRKTLSATEVENSWMYWLQPSGSILMIIAGFTVLFASEKPFSESKGLSDTGSPSEERKDSEP